MAVEYPITPTEYREVQRDVSPPWLQNDTGLNWSEAFGTIKDGATYALKEGVQQKFCDYGQFASLLLQLQDRYLDEPYNESISITRNRIKNAWKTWGYAGTEYGIKMALQHAGYSFDSIEIRTGSTPPAGWTTPHGWWDFWVIIRPPLPFDTSLWNYINYEADTPPWSIYYDTSIYFVPDGPELEIARVKNLINKWKPTHANLVAILVYVNTTPPETILTWSNQV